MKIHITSDLHTEFDSKIIKNDDSDIIIIAGDLSTYEKLYSDLEHISSLYKHVLYIPGNHEYYGSSFVDVDNILEDVKTNLKNIHVLNCDMIEIEKQRFIGTTMWFKNDPMNHWYKRDLNDFQMIKNFTQNVYQKNEEAIKFLNKNVTKNDIVITHHLPSYKSVSGNFLRSQLNRFFVCDMEYLIFDRSPKIWIHGHTHHSYDYFIENTRIICNPYGYEGYCINRYFKNDLCIEI